MSKQSSYPVDYSYFVTSYNVQTFHSATVYKGHDKVEAMRNFLAYCDKAINKPLFVEYYVHGDVCATNRVLHPRVIVMGAMH